LVDITGKGNRVRSVAVPAWVKAAIDAWTTAAGMTEGKIFRAVRKGGKVWGEDLTPGAVLQIVQHYARAMGLEKLAPHDMRRTCAKLCRKRGGDLEQIKFLLGHASIQTTERYLGVEVFLRYPREGHGLSEVKHQIDATDRSIAWYEKHFPKPGEEGATNAQP
jgi:integrase